MPFPSYLSNGINVLVARFYGVRHPKDVEKTVHSAAIISAVAGVVLLLIGLLGSPAMLRLLHGGGPCRRSSGRNLKKSVKAQNKNRVRP